MKRLTSLVCLLVLCLVCNNSFAVDQEDLIEIDLIKNQVKLVDFNLGKCKTNGEFVFELDRDNGSLTLDLAGSNISFAPLESDSLTGFADKGMPWLRARLILSGDIAFIPYAYSPQFTAKGEIDLKKKELNFDIEGGWEESSSFLEGEVKVKVKAWGGLNSFLTSRFLVVEGGK